MKRIYSILMSICMVFCLTPTFNVSAAENGTLDKELLRQIIDNRNVQSLKAVEKIPEELDPDKILKLNKDSSVIGFINTENSFNTLNIVSRNYDEKIHLPKDSSGLFKDLKSLKNIDLSSKSLNTSDVENMSEMFKDCDNLEAISMENCDTSKVTNMCHMFNSCKSLNSSKLNLTGLNTEKVESIWGMFINCKSENFVELNLSNFNVKNVKDARYMFSGCENLKWLNINNWELNESADCKCMLSFIRSDNRYICCSTSFWYKYCQDPAITGTHKPIYHDCDTSGKCKKCKNIESDLNKEILRTKIIEEKVTDLDVVGTVPKETRTFPLNENGSNVGFIEKKSDTVKLFIVASDKIYFGEDSSSLFEGLNSLINIRLNCKFVSLNKTINMNSMFKNCVNLKNVDLTGLVAEKVIDMSSMFEGCTNLKKVILNNFKAQSVKNMENMFYNCENLQHIYWDGFINKTAKNLRKMFYNCSSLTELDLQGFQCQIEFMNSMFYYCSKLKMLDLSKICVNDVENMDGVFQGCESLDHLILKNWNANNFKSFGSMLSFGKGGVVICCSDAFWEKVCTNARALGINKNKNPKHHLEGDENRCKYCNELLITGILDSEMLKSLVREKKCKKLMLNKVALPGQEQYKLNKDGSVVGYILGDCLHIAPAQLSGNVYLPENSSYFFSDLQLEEMHLNGLNTKYVRFMNYMFSNCSLLKKLDLSRFNTENLSTAICMFQGCVKLEELNMSDWTSNLNGPVQINYMFSFGDIMESEVTHHICCSDDFREYFPHASKKIVWHNFVDGVCKICHKKHEILV